MKVAFIFGSPRSGTTILAKILACHHEIAEWYEPYYIWEKYFNCNQDDIWDKGAITEEIRKNIRSEFALYCEKTKKSMVLDKLPTHAFNLEIVHKIFPEAKWIHILRDGRDVTLSIKKEWAKREQIVSQRDFIGLISVTGRMLARQPFWRYRLKAMLFELRAISSLNPRMYLNKSKWRGKAGWGPRFEGWVEYRRTHSSLEFNATQWVKSVEAVQESWPILPKKNKIEIRYEDLLRLPEVTLRKVLKILGVEPDDGFFKKIPLLKRDNFHKWEKEFKAAEINEIKPILSQLINDLGYAHTRQW
jgi:hypothetical protein